MRKTLLLIPALFLLIGCGTNKGNSESKSNVESSEPSSSSESESSESSSSEEIITGEETSFTFKTSTGDSTWPSGGLGDGSHITTFMNKLNENKTLFTNIAQNKAQFNQNNEFKTMWIGNQDGSGFVEFTTSVTVKKIEVEVQTYFKYDSYHEVMKFDANTVFSVQDKQIDLSTEEVVESSEVKKQAFTKKPPGVCPAAFLRFFTLSHRPPRPDYRGQRTIQSKRLAIYCIEKTYQIWYKYK